MAGVVRYEGCGVQNSVQVPRPCQPAAPLRKDGLEITIESWTPQICLQASFLLLSSPLLLLSLPAILYLILHLLSTFSLLPPHLCPCFCSPPSSSCFSFLSPVLLQKKEKIQLRTLRNCHQNNSLADMLVTNLRLPRSSLTVQQTRRLGVDEWSIKIISNALRTEAEIQSESTLTCLPSPFAHSEPGELVDKAEQLAKRVRKDQVTAQHLPPLSRFPWASDRCCFLVQARQALEGWWDAVFAKDAFKMND